MRDLHYSVTTRSSVSADHDVLLLKAHTKSPEQRYTNTMSDRATQSSWKPAVNAIRKYYTFLAQDLGGIPAECIVEPPETGWPSITRDSLAGLEKADAVIELLRHLPYIERSKDYNTQIAFNTSAIDYREIGAHKVGRGERWKWIPLGNKEFPPHVVVLTHEDDGYYGSLLLFNTEEGCALRYTAVTTYLIMFL